MKKLHTSLETRNQLPLKTKVKALRKEKAKVHSYTDDGMALYSEEEIQRNIWMMNDILESHPDAKEVPEIVFKLINGLSNRFQDKSSTSDEGGSN